MKIQISFKESEADLYNFLKAKRSPSIYIKDILEKEMQQDENSHLNINKNTDGEVGFDSGFDF